MSGILIAYLLICAINVFFFCFCVRSELKKGNGLTVEALFFYILFAFMPIFNIFTLFIAPLEAFPKAYNNIASFISKVGSFEIIKGK